MARRMGVLEQRDKNSNREPMTPQTYKRERRRRNLTQAELAALLGVTRATINGREAGREGFPITREAALAIKALGTKK